MACLKSVPKDVSLERFSSGSVSSARGAMGASSGTNGAARHAGTTVQLAQLSYALSEEHQCTVCSSQVHQQIHVCAAMCFRICSALRPPPKRSGLPRWSWERGEWEGGDRGSLLERSAGGGGYCGDA